MQTGFYFDQTRCTGCYTCVVACKDWHDVPAGPASWRRVVTIEEGKFPDVFVAWLATSCYHGIVVVDQAKCLGKDKCDLCLQSCPYEAPQFGAEKNAKMQMCNLCFDRLKEGKKPICVAGCPMRALDAGPIDELRARYGDKTEAVVFTHSADLKPSVVFKPKRKKSLVGGRK
jgi:anaerobic dimethyl sulfoxide reductase subunit B (iron-sulfur subunit)